MVERLPSARASPRRPLLGVLAAAAVLALVAVPAALCAYAAVLSFVGWSLYADGDASPDIPVGVLYTALTLVLLAMPVLAGLITARVSLGPAHHRARNVWWAVVGVLAVILVATSYRYVFSAL